MGKLGDKFVILLDVGKVLSIDELSTLEDMAQERPEGVAYATVAA
jgi:hypothetical protein